MIFGAEEKLVHPKTENTRARTPASGRVNGLMEEDKILIIIILFVCLTYGFLTCQVMNIRLPNHQFTADPFPLCLFGHQQVKAGGEFARW